MNEENQGYREIFETLRREVLEGKYDETQKLPSENQLARRFKVCRPTVSKAMNELSQAGLIARRKGAPALLSRFARNLSGSLGVVVQGEWNDSDLFPKVCRRIMSLAEKRGWRVIRYSIKATAKRDRVREIKEIAEDLVREHVSGVFFQPLECVRESFQCNQDVVVQLSTSGVQVVLLDYDICAMPRRSGYDLVGVDNFAAGFSIGRHLVEQGAKRVAFLSQPFAADSVQCRKRGVAAALIEAGLKWRPWAFDMQSETLNRKFVKDFVGRHRPDAIVAWNDEAALRLFGMLAKLGIRVPDDIMLAGFDDIPNAASAPAPLTTMRQPIDVLATMALHTLVTRVKSPDLPPRKTLVPCELLQRTSTMR